MRKQQLRGDFPPVRSLNERYPRANPANDVVSNPSVRSFCAEPDQKNVISAFRLEKKKNTSLYRKFKAEIDEEGLDDASDSDNDDLWDFVKANRGRFCQIALMAAKSQTTKKLRQTDRRRLRLPRDIYQTIEILELEQSLMTTNAQTVLFGGNGDAKWQNFVRRYPNLAPYMAMTRTERAKKHLDRARQMFRAASKAILKAQLVIEDMAKSELDAEARQKRKRAAEVQLRKWNKMIYRLKPFRAGQFSMPSASHTSACAELLSAYLLIRSYEICPSAPLITLGQLKSEFHANPNRFAEAKMVKRGTTSDWKVPDSLFAEDDGLVIPNPVRVLEDRYYQLVMGTQRCEPNALHLSDQVRRVWDSWRLNGDVSELPFLRECFDHNFVSFGEGSSPPLYDNVQHEQVPLDVFYQDQDSPPLPAVATALAFRRAVEFGVIKDAASFRGTTTKSPIRIIAELPDMSRAIAEIHRFLPPPNSNYIGSSYPGYRELQVQLPGGDGNVLIDDKALVPSLHSIDSEAKTVTLNDLQQLGLLETGHDGSLVPSVAVFPTVEVEADGKRVQVEPAPVIGMPDRTMHHWDLRLPLSFLASEKDRLSQETRWMVADSNFRVGDDPSQTVPLNIQSWQIGGPEQNRAGPTTHTMNQQGLQGWERKGNVMVHGSFKLSLPDFQHAQQGQGDRVIAPIPIEDEPVEFAEEEEKDDDTKRRLFAHAMYLLSAETNPYLSEIAKSKTEDEAWQMQYQTCCVGAPTTSSDFRRTSQGRSTRMMPHGRGWNTYSIGDIIGPLLLDEQFASDVNHLPSPLYQPEDEIETRRQDIHRIWLRKTADDQVDFYRPEDDDEDKNRGDGMMFYGKKDKKIQEREGKRRKDVERQDDDDDDDGGRRDRYVGGYDEQQEQPEWEKMEEEEKKQEDRNEAEFKADEGNGGDGKESQGSETIAGLLKSFPAFRGTFDSLGANVDAFTPALLQMWRQIGDIMKRSGATLAAENIEGKHSDRKTETLIRDINQLCEQQKPGEVKAEAEDWVVHNILEAKEGSYLYLKKEGTTIALCFIRPWQESKRLVVRFHDAKLKKPFKQKGGTSSSLGPAALAELRKQLSVPVIDGNLGHFDDMFRTQLGKLVTLTPVEKKSGYFQKWRGIYQPMTDRKHVGDPSGAHWLSTETDVPDKQKEYDWAGSESEIREQAQKQVERLNAIEGRGGKIAELLLVCAKKDSEIPAARLMMFVGMAAMATQGYEAAFLEVAPFNPNDKVAKLQRFYNEFGFEPVMPVLGSTIPKEWQKDKEFAARVAAIQSSSLSSSSSSSSSPTTYAMLTDMRFYRLFDSDGSVLLAIPRGRWPPFMLSARLIQTPDVITKVLEARSKR